MKDNIPIVVQGSSELSTDVLTAALLFEELDLSVQTKLLELLRTMSDT